MRLTKVHGGGEEGGALYLYSSNLKKYSTGQLGQDDGQDEGQEGNTVTGVAKWQEKAGKGQGWQVGPMK